MGSGSVINKTIKAKIFGLTTTKEALLQQEYDNWQSYLRGIKKYLYILRRKTKPIIYSAHWVNHSTKRKYINGTLGRRPHQGLFVCECGLQYNADLNGAMNIGRRFLDQVFGNSGAFDTPLDFGDVRPLG